MSIVNICLFLVRVIINVFFRPYERMDPYLKMLFKYLPTGLPSVSFNNVIFKEYDILHPNVVIGVLLLTVWAVGLFLISYLYLIKKKYRKS